MAPSKPVNGTKTAQGVKKRGYSEKRLQLKACTVRSRQTEPPLLIYFINLMNELLVFMKERNKDIKGGVWKCKIKGGI